MFYDTNEVNEDGQVYIEKSIPLMWGCFLAGGLLLVFALVVAAVVVKLMV